jgi:HAD superfamily hydrolase (TIGR01509 family)
MQPRAVIFDLGGTLWFDAVPPSEEKIRDVQQRVVAPVFDELGITLSRRLGELNAAVWGAVEAAYVVERERGTFRDPSLPFLWKGALAAENIDITDEQANRIWVAAWVSPADLGIQLFPDTLDVLKALRAAGIAIAVNTTRPCTSDMLMRNLTDFGIERYVDAAVCSGDVGYFKPHPAPFERTLALLGVRADQALMVGDSDEADVAGAHALGIPSVWKLNGRYGLPPSRHADHTIHDLSELLALPVFESLEHHPPAESPTPHEDNNEDRY